MHRLGFTRRPPKAGGIRKVLIALNAKAFEHALTQWVGTLLSRPITAKPSLPEAYCPVNLRLKGKQDRRQHGHDKSPKKSKIRKKITTRKRIKSTIKIKSRTSCTRQRNAGRPALRRDLAPTPALALSSLPDPTLHLSLSLM